MNVRRRLALLIAVTQFILTASGLSPALSQEKPGNPAYDWLNGKWYGPVELELRVINDNQITGKSGFRGSTPKPAMINSVSGSVDGDKVHLDLYRGDRTERLTFSHKDGVLRGTRKGQVIIFKK